MTAPEQQNEKTAAVWFAGFMALALGGAGFLVAVLAVGIERAWTGGAGETGRARERRRSWLDEQRSWLDNDHRQRLARTKARQDWYAGGADPAAEPKSPGLLRRLGEGLHRVAAHVAVAGRDFAQGCRDGARAANTERRKPNTGSWWDQFRRVAAARPGAKQKPEPDDTSDDEPDAEPDEPVDRKPTRQHGPPCGVCGFPLATGPDGTTTCGICDWALDGSADQKPAAADIPSNEQTLPERPCPRCQQTATLTPSGWCETCTMRQPHGFCPACNGATRLDGNTWAHGPDWPCTHRQPLEASHTITCDGCGTAQPMHPSMQAAGMRLESCPACPVPTSTERPDQARAIPTEGEPMATTAQRTPNGTPAEKGDTNAEVLRNKLQAIKASTEHVTEHTDALAKLQQSIANQVKDADDYAKATGQSAQSRQALDETNVLVGSMTGHLDQFSTQATSAEDQLVQAAAGLKVADDASDRLRSAGATSDAIAPAGAHA